MVPPTDPDVFVGVASIPDREASLRNVIERLLPQARTIGVYLNGYDRVPEFLRHDRIVVARSQDHGDVRDNGKFYFLDRTRHQYYATVDDDISYPSDYLEKLVGCLQSADQLAAVGVHGALYPDPIIDLFDARVLLHFEKSTPHILPAHLLGTGTALIDQHAWGLRFDEFGTPGMADVWFAKAAMTRGASCFVVPRKRKWLEPIRRERSAGGALFHEGLHQSSEQVTVLREAAPSGSGTDGLVRSLVASTQFLEDLSLHQALLLDRMRRQLGFAPISEPVAEAVRTAVDQLGRSWPHAAPVSSEDLRAHGRLIVCLLAGTVSADSVDPVISVLDRMNALADRDPDTWGELPYRVRGDSRPDRYDEVRSALIGLGMRAGPAEAKRLWSFYEHRETVALDQALLAQRASCDTRFERLPALAERARDHPESAVKFLYEFLQIVGGSRAPDVTALRLVFGDEFDTLDIALPVCQAALRSGDRELCGRLVANLRTRWPSDVDVRLMSARLGAEADDLGTVDLAPVLGVLDETLLREKLVPWTEMLGPQTGDHWIHALDAPHRPVGEAAGLPVVSVIMTTHNDVDTIESAVGSILASSGVVVELVVVDDRSTDGTLDIVTRLDDRRVKVVSNQRNLGPYVSRNRALEHCTGTYVAIADADDWSHPERLSFQCSVLDELPYVHACKVAHVRVCANGEIDLENNSRFVGEGPMSLMFRRWLIDHIGGFDHIRTRGDVEFMRRLQARFGVGSLLSAGVPLVLASSSPQSNSKRFSEDSLNLYRSASRQWHDRHRGRDSLYVPLAAGRAPFMAPHDLVVGEAPPSSDGQV